MSTLFCQPQTAVDKLFQQNNYQQQQQQIQRSFNLSAPKLLEGTSESFREAVNNLSGVQETDNHTKLKLYALFKQATIGKNNIKVCVYIFVLSYVSIDRSFTR